MAAFQNGHGFQAKLGITAACVGSRSPDFRKVEELGGSPNGEDQVPGMYLWRRAGIDAEQASRQRVHLRCEPLAGSRKKRTIDNTDLAFEVTGRGSCQWSSRFKSSEERTCGHRREDDHYQRNRT